MTPVKTACHLTAQTTNFFVTGVRFVMRRIRVVDIPEILVKQELFVTKRKIPVSLSRVEMISATRERTVITVPMTVLAVR